MQEKREGRCLENGINAGLRKPGGELHHLSHAGIHGYYPYNDL
jgi:hypothetical protein